MLSAVEMDKLAEFYGMSLDEFLRSGQPVLHMHDHSSQGFNAYHMQHQHGVSDDLMKQFIDALTANARAIEKLAEQQVRMNDPLA